MSSSSLKIESLKLTGYGSFQHVNVPFGEINVLLGEDSVGMSNFLSVFRVINAMMRRELAIYVAQRGGNQCILHRGNEYADIVVKLRQDQETDFTYKVRLRPLGHDVLVADEELLKNGRVVRSRKSEQHHESSLPLWADKDKTAKLVYQTLASSRVYNFCDTSENARLRQPSYIYDNMFLHERAGNLTAYLYLLRERYPDSYRNIISSVRRVAESFDDFIIRPIAGNNDILKMEWCEKERDDSFSISMMPDGLLRFVCLATLFLQPVEKMPPFIVLDEPELGQSSHALSALAEMVKAVSSHTPVIMATQSDYLAESFNPQSTLVVERHKGLSTINRRGVPKNDRIQFHPNITQASRTSGADDISYTP